jgi:hypothetical protein
MSALLDIPEARLRAKLNPAIYVEKTDKDPTCEEVRQAEYVATVRKNFRALKVFAVPNAGRRTMWEANKVKREGLSKGWPDTGTCWDNGRTAWIEWKDGRGSLGDDQIETLNWLHDQGFPVAVCRTAYGALLFLRSVGAPVNIGGAL